MRHTSRALSLRSRVRPRYLKRAHDRRTAVAVWVRVRRPASALSRAAAILAGGHSITSAPRATRHHRRRQSRRRLRSAHGVAHSPPDGYSSLLGSTSAQALLTPVMANPPYDPVKDFSTLAGSPLGKRDDRCAICGPNATLRA
jgi:hypothetical protein